MVYKTDLNEKYWIYEVTHPTHDCEEEAIFHIVSDNGRDYPFYCPVCYIERGKIANLWKGHTSKCLGEVTTEEILSILEGRK